MPTYFLSNDQEVAAQQARAEYQDKLAPFNRPAPTPFPDETADKYRQRALPILQSVTPGFEDLKIDGYLREPNFKYVEKQIFEAAEKEARQPTRIPDGELREVRKLDQSGRPFYEFHGRAGAWMNDFTAGTTKGLTGIRTETERGYVPGNMVGSVKFIR